MSDLTTLIQAVREADYNLTQAEIALSDYLFEMDAARPDLSALPDRVRSDIITSVQGRRYDHDYDAGMRGDAAVRPKLTGWLT